MGVDSYIHIYIYMFVYIHINVYVSVVGVYLVEAVTWFGGFPRMVGFAMEIIERF